MFELDLRDSVLLKDGRPVHIPDKPFLMLALLLEHAGEVVTREELRQHLWPSDTFVEFDDNLNTTVKRVREALGDAAGQPRYIQTVPRRGYRFLPPVERLEEPARKSRTSAIAAAIAAAAILAAGSTWLLQAHFASTPKRTLMAVLPFRNVSGDAAQEYLSDGVTEELIAHLGRLSPSKLGVISVTSVMRYRQTSEDAGRIGRELGVRYLLEGSIRKAGDRIAVTTQLVNVTDGADLWSETYDRPAGDLAAVQREVATGVAQALALHLLPGEAAVLARADTTNTSAYDAYLAGLYQWNRGTRDGFQEALQDFERAVALDPSYALAHDGIARCYLELGDYRLIPPEEAAAKAQQEVSTSLRLDDSVPESHAIAAALLDRTSPAATGVDEGYRRALDLNPSDSIARRTYAMYLLGRGKKSEAAAQAMDAVRMDPLSPSAHSYAGWVLRGAGDIRGAWEQSRRALELDPNYPFALYIQGHLYQHDGNFERAIGQFQKAATASGRAPKYVYALARAYLAAGKKDPARKLAVELREKSASGYVPPEYLEQLKNVLR
ncbi:MAG TPA: winged helix-turn-helix domain-containing protein [Bryobacteraceae bacterium]|nr:winged helix-turn-helix domain-containing protein [Bryobacteraceae bacterium]